MTYVIRCPACGEEWAAGLDPRDGRMILYCRSTTAPPCEDCLREGRAVLRSGPAARPVSIPLGGWERKGLTPSAGPEETYLVL